MVAFIFRNFAVVFFPVVFCVVGGGSLGSADVKIEVDAASVINTMRGGMGASWHAIEEPIPYGPGKTEGGSAWGGHPPAEDQKAWREIYRHADWLGLDWCRVEVEQRMYQPRRDRFDWDNGEMRILHRILDWCQRRKADVFLQQMWGNVEWNTFPEWRDDATRRVHSGPLSMEDFAGGLAALVEHLVRRKGYTCIRWLSIVNEPGHGWSWWQRPPNEPMPLKPGLAAVRKALDEKGLEVPLSGPDWTDLPPLEPEKIDFDHLIGAYDIHSYWANFDWREGGYPLSVAEKRLADWAKWAHRRKKPLFLSEVGSMAFGWRDSHPGPSSHEAGLKDVEIVIRGLGVGIDAFNRWSFVNRGDLDGQWQMINTWDREKKKLLKEITPHANSYFLYGLLTRFTAKHSSVLKSRVQGGILEDHRRVFAAALRSPAGHLTLLVVNDADREWDATFSLSGSQEARTLHRYRRTGADRDRADVPVEAAAEFELPEGGGTFRDSLPASSASVYTTYRLSHHQAGIIAEEGRR